MKKFVAIPLVAVMLAALAAPALAEEGSENVNTSSGTPTQISVQGKYDPTTAATTVYSVDIKWGNMKAIYAPDRTKEWNPETLTFTDIEGAHNPWTWDRTTSSNGLEPNQVAITNKSSTNITCNLSFSSELSGVNGEIVGKTGESQDTFTILSATGETGTIAEKLAKTTASGFLKLSGSLSSDQDDFKEIGTIAVTIQ